jgi:hypothetical protein
MTERHDKARSHHRFRPLGLATLRAFQLVAEKGEEIFDVVCFE